MSTLKDLLSAHGILRDLRGNYRDISSLAAEMDHNQDPMLKKVYADWLEEQGYHKLAHTYRWAVKHTKHPYVTAKKKNICWSLSRTLWLPHPIPQIVLAEEFYYSLLGKRRNTHIKHSWGKQSVVTYITVDMAFLDLSNSLWLIRDRTEA